MDKTSILKLCIAINVIFLSIFFSSFVIFNNGESNYFRFGWYDNFTFISITIDSQERYFSLCFFIVILNISEIFLNDIAYPLINFSTYNPYKVEISDFSRSELEFYSNIIYFVQGSKKLLQIATTVSQIDLAFITLLSSQSSIYFVIKFLLDKKKFIKDSENNSSIIENDSYQYMSVSYDTNDHFTGSINIV